MFTTLRSVALSSACAALLLCACNGDGNGNGGPVNEAPDAGAPADSDDDGEPLADEEEGEEGAELLLPTGGDYNGPDFSISIEVMESMPEQYAATIQVTALTGGWELSIDDAALVDGTLKLFATLVRPADDEIVTQALVDHEARHQTGTERIERVELYVSHYKRGQAPAEPMYALAATEG